MRVPAPSRLPRSTALIACAISLGLLVPGCASNAPEPPPAPASTQASAEHPTPNETPTGGALLECGRDVKDTLADVDLTTATWTAPANFEESDAFEQVNAYETEDVDLWVGGYVGPGTSGSSAIAVTLYPDVEWGDLSGDCAQVPIEAALERVAQYWQTPGTTDVPVGEAEMTTVAGMPTVTQDFTFDGLYARGWWVYSRTQLLHLQCQWRLEEERAGVEAGCAEFIASMEVG